MNWSKIISDMQAWGWTQARIATAMGGKPQSWVADVLKGRYRDLKWSDGQRLIRLHKREAKKLAKSDCFPPPVSLNEV